MLIQNNETFQIVSRILRTMEVLGGYGMLCSVVDVTGLMRALKQRRFRAAW